MGAEQDIVKRGDCPLLPQCKTPLGTTGLGSVSSILGVAQDCWKKKSLGRLDETFGPCFPVKIFTSPYFTINLIIIGSLLLFFGKG